MARRFRIDASQKIQASPIDFDMLREEYNAMVTTAKVETEIANNKQEIISYANSKFKELSQQINSDIDKVISEWVDLDYVNEFFKVVADVSRENSGTSWNGKSSVLEGLEYSAEGDDDYTWYSIESKDYGDLDEFYDSCEVNLLWCSLHTYEYDEYDPEHPDENIRFFTPVAYGGNSAQFVDLLTHILCMPKYMAQLSQDNIVDVCERIVNEFTKFIDASCSDLLERALKKYWQD